MLNRISAYDAHTFTQKPAAGTATNSMRPPIRTIS